MALHRVKLFQLWALPALKWYYNFYRYLDGVFVAGNQGLNSTVPVRFPLSGNVHLIQDLFYLIQVEYSSIRSTSIQTSKQLILQMFEDGAPRSIPAESLYISEHFTGSPDRKSVV